MIEIPKVSTAPQGWQCPVCHRVYSPHTAMCLNCPNSDKTYTTGSTTITPTPHKVTIEPNPKTII